MGEVDSRILKMLEYGRSLLKDDEVLEWGGTIRIYKRKDEPEVNPYTPRERLYPTLKELEEVRKFERRKE